MIIHVVREITWEGCYINTVIDLKAFKSLDTAKAYVCSLVSKKKDSKPNIEVAYQINDIFLEE